MSEDEKKSLRDEIHALFDRYGVVDYAWVGIDILGTPAGKFRCGSTGSSESNDLRVHLLSGLMNQVNWDLLDRYDHKPWEIPE